ncbi:MAG: hypothetical protein PHR82_08975 [Endomicrobiaceae bacterium]|nr:hypothetical protein [Endomicrobiaceae bacterium]
MEINRWVDGYKIQAFPWVDGEKTIYVNVQYYSPGSSLSQPPAMDKSVWIINDVAGRRFVYEYTATAVNYIAHLFIPTDAQLIIKIEDTNTMRK